MQIKLKLVEVSGQRRYVRIWWGSIEPEKHKGWGYHNALQEISDIVPNEDLAIHSATDEEYEKYFPRWPHVCEICGTPVPARGTNNAHYDIFYEHLYDNPPRLLRPGDMYRTPWMGQGDDCYDVVLPLEMTYDHRYYTWNTHQVASNCEHGNRQLHKCWQTQGTPPDITVSPSIAYPGLHCFIRKGQIIDA